jgi:hypothetical protein
LLRWQSSSTLEPHYSKSGGRATTEKLVSGPEFGPGSSVTSDVSQPGDSNHSAQTEERRRAQTQLALRDDV